MNTSTHPVDAAHDARCRVLRPRGAYTFLESPFAYVQSSPCLPPDQYEALARTFPDLSLFGDGVAQADHRVFRIPSSRVLAEPAFSEEWKWFVEQHTSPAFWQQLVAIFGAQLHQEFSRLEGLLERPMERWRAVRRGSGETGDVTLECQIVVNTPVRGAASSVKAPHVDHVRKLWTGLLYMRDPADDTAGGDLQLYRALDGLRFDAHQAPRSGVVHEATARYATNSFVGFVNGPQAVQSARVRRPCTCGATSTSSPRLTTPRSSCRR